MAEFDFNIPKEFFDQFVKLGDNAGEVQQKMLKEAAPILENSMKKQLSKHKDTGELVESIQAGTPQENDRGWYIVVSPRGYSSTKKYFAKNKRGKTTTRKYKLSNAAKLIWLEYGTENQPARPTLTKATNDANISAIEKMQEVFNREVNGK